MKTNNYIILGLLALGFMACEMRDELKKLPSKEDQQEEGWFTLDVVSNGQNQTTKAAFDSAARTRSLRGLNRPFAAAAAWCWWPATSLRAWAR